MFKRGALILLFLLPAFSLAVDYTVTRQFQSPVNAGTDVRVQLIVDVGPNTDAYAIDEVYPTGWTLKDAGGGSSQQAGHLKFLVIGEQSSNYSCGVDGCVSSVQDKTYNYTLTAPTSAQTGTFSGSYMFDTQSAESQIQGSTSIQVVIPVSLCNDFTSQATCAGNSACSWCPLGTPVCRNSSLVQCTASGCINNISYCSACGIVLCGHSQVCSDGACQNIQPPANNTNTSQNITPTCIPLWSCSWTACEDIGGAGRQTGTCTDSLCNSSAKTETRSCRIGTPASNTTTSGGTSSSGRTPSSPTNTSGTASGTTRTRTIPDQPVDQGSASVPSRNPASTNTNSGNTQQRTLPSTDDLAKPPLTQEEVLADQQGTSDSLFYILAGILGVMVIVGGVYIYKRRISLTKQEPPRSPPGLVPPRAF